MKKLLLFIIVCFVLFILYYEYTNYDMVNVISVIDKKKYSVRNREDKNKASNMLAKINENIKKLTFYLMSNIDKFKEYEPYIIQLNNNIESVIISETPFNSNYTSYTVNKGDKILFCLRNKVSSKLLDKNNLHDINLIMYVALHEISHVACPEYNHTPLFNKIFKFFCLEAINIGIYNKIDYSKNPANYCGMTVDNSII
uniref:WLM domain-containing protein n=1 Tax=viral metagenome TaxID=1070528 RepID=A0A6C0DZY7_9ZZZZ